MILRQILPLTCRYDTNLLNAVFSLRPPVLDPLPARFAC